MLSHGWSSITWLEFSVPTASFTCKAVQICKSPLPNREFQSETKGQWVSCQIGVKTVFEKQFWFSLCSILASKFCLLHLEICPLMTGVAELVRQQMACCNKFSTLLSLLGLGQCDSLEASESLWLWWHCPKYGVSCCLLKKRYSSGVWLGLEGSPSCLSLALSN